MTSHLTQSRIRIEKDIVVRVKRNLKGKGTLNVSVGQEVTPAEIIGTATISSGFRTINLAHELSVSPDSVQKYLVKPIGQRIYKDELLAFKGGTILGGKKVVTSPTDGVLELLNPKTGELKMTFLPARADLPAGVFGVVEVVDKDRGFVVIRAQVTRIHGMFGSGRLRDGILHLLSKRDELVSKPMISSEYDENVLVGGSLIFKDAISSAISQGVNGIITGGINAKDYKAMAGGRITFPKKIDNDVGLSIVICEGFGSIPIGEDIFGILEIYEGKFVSINGNPGILDLPSFESKSMIKVRSTKLSPESSLKEENQSRPVELSEGMRVRIIGNSFAGDQGIVRAIDGAQTFLPSGVKAYMVTVETKRKKLQLPVANIEVLDYSHMIND